MEMLSSAIMKRQENADRNPRLPVTIHAGQQGVCCFWESADTGDCGLFNEHTVVTACPDTYRESWRPSTPFRGADLDRDVLLLPEPKAPTASVDLETRSTATVCWPRDTQSQPRVPCILSAMVANVLSGSLVATKPEEARCRFCCY